MIQFSTRNWFFEKNNKKWILKLELWKKTKLTWASKSFLANISSFSVDLQEKDWLKNFFLQLTH